MDLRVICCFQKGSIQDHQTRRKVRGAYAPRPWPNRTIPYNLSAITCECHHQTRSKFFAMTIRL